ncbi:hypothetical protein H6F38_27380 [Paenibacillus sp. EKM208P]|nr:hypothetical protein H6F38_27380 [Paenibacillus sp. EKM208P]
MERLELTLHPTKTRIVGLWTGEEGFDFLGMHHRKTKAETSESQVYYTTQQWLCRKAEERIREVVKERLALANMRHKSFREHLEYLNPKIQGWRTAKGRWLNVTCTSFSDSQNGMPRSV